MKLSPDIRIVQTWLSRKPLWRASMIVAWSIFILLVASVAYWKDFQKAAEWMPVFQSAITVKHEYWRLWTALFAHADLGHLLSNSLTYFVVGYFLAGYFSLWLFPVLAFAMGGLINYLVVMGYPSDIRLIGVSGVVYWMAGAWLVLYFLIDKRKTFTQRTLRSIGVALGVFFPAAAFDPAISYKAHLYGFILGVFSGAVYWVLNRKTFENALVYEVRYEEDLEQLNSESTDAAVTSDSIN
jgi:rhomboid protease GluP